MADSATDDRGSLVGRTLAGFRVLRPLGRGGMGEVYLAREEALGRQVVLKFLASRWASDVNLVRRFGREVRAAALLNHPNVVTVYSFHEAEGLSFYAMEYVEGQSLADAIARQAPLEVWRALTIAGQVADALACAHKAGILHRDIKPPNILLTSDERVKVVDFGVAKILSDRTELTVDGSFLGTLSYASPEQCEGAELDARTDIYSLGVVLYEMLAGQLPYKADTPLTLVKQIVYEPLPDLAAFNPTVPASVKHLAEKMLRKQRDLRFPDGEAVSIAIRQTLREIETAQPAAASVSATTPMTATDAAVALPTRPEVPLGRPAESAVQAPRRSRPIRKTVLWTVGALFVVAVFNRLANNPRTTRQGTSSGTTTTLTSQQTTPTPSPSPTPQPQPTPTPVAVRPTATPIFAAPTPSVAQAAFFFSPEAVLRHVPANRDLAIGLHIRSLLRSTLIRSNESKVFSPQATTNLDTFFGYFGLDWRRDIDYLLISGITARPDSLCLTFLGRWDESFVIAQLRNRPGYRVFQQDGRSIHGLPAPDGSRIDCVVFLGPGVAACGSPQVLRQVCDAASGRAPLSALQSVRKAIAGLRDSPDFWALGIRQLGPANPALAKLDAWVLQGRLTPDLDLTGTAWPTNRNEIEGAYNLLNVLVQAWRKDQKDAELRQLGMNTFVSRSADTLSVRVRVPYSDLVRLLDAAAAKGTYPFK